MHFVSRGASRHPVQKHCELIFSRVAPRATRRSGELLPLKHHQGSCPGTRLRRVVRGSSGHWASSEVGRLRASPESGDDPIHR